jgi:hypothetical protein
VDVDEELLSSLGYVEEKGSQGIFRKSPDFGIFQQRQGKNHE